MKKRTAAIVLSAMMAAACVTGCGAKEAASTETKTEAAPQTEESRKEETTAEETKDADKEAADEVAAMIDAIYVQTRTEKTDEQCEQAKKRLGRFDRCPEGNGGRRRSRSGLLRTRHRGCF